MKVRKDNVVKEVEDCIVADYVTAGWTVEKKKNQIKKIKIWASMNYSFEFELSHKSIQNLVKNIKNFHKGLETAKSIYLKL